MDSCGVDCRYVVGEVDVEGEYMHIME